MANPDDDAAFLRVINTPRREIGPVTVEKLANYAAERDVSLMEACGEMGLATLLPERAIQRLQYFVNWIAAMSEQAEGDDIKSLLADLIKDIDYELWLQDTSKDLAAAERKMENVQELIDWIHHMVDINERELQLSELISQKQLQDILDRDEKENQKDGVNLMTLHSAKGLEFPHVTIVGMEEELLPHHASIDENSIEEERRLAYVGITRAQRTLILSHAARRKRHGEVIRCEPSRFIDELPESTLLRESNSQVDPEVRQQQGRAHLDNLRGILG